MGNLLKLGVLPSTFLLLMLIIWRSESLVFESTTEHVHEKDVPSPQSTGLIKDADSLLVLSMLDGSLIGVDHLTGLVRWRLHNEPVVKVPLDSKNSVEPVFLPDPKDGSLYVLASEPSTGRTSTLKKLPFTIQQLVASSPCRGSDGMFYTGKKIDSWFSVNWKTGKKTQVLSFDQLEKSCPVPALDDIFIGRTEYNILMYDSKNKNRQWNVTFFDYSTQTMSSEDMTNYGLVHFGGSSSGRVSTYDRSSGRLLWDRDFGSPLVGVFLRVDQDMTSVPFTSVEDHTLDRLAWSQDRDHLYPSLYVGEHPHGLYALPTLVGQHSPHSIETQAVLLIEGPNTTDTHNSILGHYPVPDYSTTRLQIAGRSDVIIPPVMGGFNGSKVGGGAASPPASPPAPAPAAPAVVEWFLAIEHKPLYFFIFLLLLGMAAMFFYVQAQVIIPLYGIETYFIWMGIPELIMPAVEENTTCATGLPTQLKQIFNMVLRTAALVQALQQSQHSSRGSSRESWGSAVTAAAEVMSDGIVRVGKINFDTTRVLGKGCEGTFVFRGEFESRAVAVKRLLPECFTVADREVSLLRESDAHANVVRYFCTEQDSQFRYIALELCAATLQDYVERQMFNDFLGPKDVLSQATAGLSHLHSLNIVHRDIKPHNVLLSVPTAGGQVRAMISDFGLCKKLQNGRTSFSRRSGVTGTDGWIAPEIILGNSRTMCHVDIFSLGCVFYYVLSQGKHPFGDTLHRQANILSNSYKLAGLSVLWQGLIEQMISCEPLQRPPADVVLHHPALWDSSRVLTFLQDCSDRVEKEEVTGAVLAALETGARSVCVCGDWRAAVDGEVTADLRKYRSYRGDSVRDLLRALRNKRHHFRELSASAQELLGSTPDSFTHYWLSRFPLLLPHSWACMQCVRHEPLFASYYRGSYTFPPPPTDGALPPWWDEKKQEILSPRKQPSPSKNSPRHHNRRGSDMNEGNDSPNNRRRNVSDLPGSEQKEGEDEEKENWMKSGQEKGVYRPRMRRKPRKKEEENIIWSVPP